MGDTKTKLSQKVKSRRVELQLTQSELAALAGIDRAHVSRIESGSITRLNPLSVHRTTHLLFICQHFKPHLQKSNNFPHTWAKKHRHKTRTTYKASPQICGDV